jgi:hypothetical protein
MATGRSFFRGLPLAADKIADKNALEVLRLARCSNQNALLTIDR